MEKLNYDAYDEKLLELIEAGKNTAMILKYKSELRELAEPHRKKVRGTLTPYFRVVDKRLQALRKKGVIRFNGKHWELLVSI